MAAFVHDSYSSARSVSWNIASSGLCGRQPWTSSSSLQQRRRMSKNEAMVRRETKTAPLENKADREKAYLIDFGQNFFME